jgi:hypothetical protein
MAGLGAAYSKDVWKQRGVCAIYPPGETLKLGDVYEYHRGAYNFRTTLDTLGIPVSKRRSEALKSWDCSSRNTCTVVTKVKGKVPSGVVTKVLGKADAGAVIKFTSETAYLMSLADIAVQQLVNTEEVETAVKDLFWRNNWDTSYLIVTQVWTAKRATIITSGSTSTQVELSAAADVKLSKAVEVVDLSAGYRTADKGQATDIFVSETLTPLFRARRLSLLGALKPAGRKGGYLDSMVAPDVLGRLAIGSLPSSPETPDVEFREFDPTVA